MEPVYVAIAVEGPTDVAVADRLLDLVGRKRHRTFGQEGKQALDKGLAGYNRAAHLGPWLVLRDLDRDAPCPGALVQSLLPNPAPQMRLRVAVHAVESWLLADDEAMSRFLRITRGQIPPTPDSLPDPKAALVYLARKSTSSAVRADMVPAEGTSARVGPGYTTRVQQFTRELWRPAVAASRSPSLSRCIEALKTLA